MFARHRLHQLNQRQGGFTLIEALVVLMIMAVLFGLVSANLGSPQATGSLDSAVEGLVADLKGQQVLAMAGDQGSTTTQQPQGVRFAAGTYTLFAGSTFNAGDANNYVASPTSDITLSTTLPSAQIIFNKGTGDVAGFVSGSNTITLSRSGVTSKVITINRFGTVTVN